MFFVPTRMFFVPLAIMYLMDDALHGSRLGMLTLIFYVSTSRKPFVPLWEYCLFQVLSDVIMRSCACLMPTSDFGSLEIWILFSLAYLVDLHARALLLFGSHLVRCGLMDISCVSRVRLSGGLLWALCISVEGASSFITVALFLCPFLLSLMRILKSIVRNDWTWLYWPCVVLFGTWVPYSLILSYCVSIIS